MSAVENGDHRRVSDSVVHKLASLLMEAKRGNVDAVCVITVGADGKPRAHFAGEGDLIPSVNLGLDIFKATIMAQVVGAPGAVELRSGIVLPGG
ncbi:MAG TPA: hypothetical protein VNH21_03130 [Steroidobacteraceae bacterium]|nr:hypothetical protein [Steroidobacteraceae bacterium]